MKCKLYAVNHSKLSKVPVVSGQLISTKDVSGFYYDMNSTRHALQPKDDVLYSLIPKANTTSTGVAVNIDYSVTSGSLEGKVNVNACVYASLEFVFYDKARVRSFPLDFMDFRTEMMDCTRTTGAPKLAQAWTPTLPKQ